MDPVKKPPNTISLVGMPGAGKSTVGVLLAKLTGLQFRDTDLDIQVFAGATLQQIIEAQGHIKLRQIEQQVLMDIPLDHSVISTGGSVVYSEQAMQRLASSGPIVYLEADLPTLELRVAAAPLRGIASGNHQSFADIFHERTPLYRHYANHTVSSTDGTADEVAANILQSLQQRPAPSA
ncbi:MAG: shikimate kinase [Halioglobus sp.]